MEILLILAAWAIGLYLYKKIKHQKNKNRYRKK